MLTRGGAEKWRIPVERPTARGRGTAFQSTGAQRALSYTRRSRALDALVADLRMCIFWGLRVSV